ncbi:hypothetical protein ACTFIR_011917 [Dictyostelium discoideum]
MSLDNIERKGGQEALVFFHQRKAEEGSIILSTERVETAIHILTDVDSYTERRDLFKECTLISEHDIIYPFSKQSLLNAFSRLGLYIDVYQKIESTESPNGAVLDRIQLFGPAVRAIKELIYSNQQVSGGPSSRGSTSFQKENQFVREVD